MTYQPRRLREDTIKLLARDLDIPLETVFTATISDGRGNFRLLVPENARVEGPPQGEQKRSILEIVARLIDEIATLQRQAITQKRTLSYYSIFPILGSQGERHCKKVITDAGDIDHQDSRVTR